MEQIYLTRMDEGIRVMREVIAAEKPFSLLFWHMDEDELNEHFGPGWKHGIASGNMEHTCQTAACAIGWMSADPWHIRQGLGKGTFEDGPRLPFFRDRRTNRILTEWEAVAAYFSITTDEGKALFGFDDDVEPPPYRSASAVLADMIAFRAEMQQRHDRRIANQPVEILF